MRSKFWKTSPTQLTVPNRQYPWILDLGCGFGGLSYGFRQAGFAAVGLDIDPHCVRKYRAHVGVAVVQDLRSYEPTRPVLVVAADLPFRGGQELLPHVLRIATSAQVLWLSRAGGAGMAQEMAALKEAKWYVAAKTYALEAWGVPQYKRREVVLGFRNQRPFERFTWPRPPPDQSEVSVREAVGRPYDLPAPRLIKDSEHRWMRHTAQVRSSTEIMAMVAGESAWGKPLALWPWELAVLAGLPIEWDWKQEVRNVAHPRIAQAFPPVIAQAVGARILQAFRAAGPKYAKYLGT